MAHIRQSGPDSGLGFQVKVLKMFLVVPSSLGSGEGGTSEEGRLEFDSHLPFNFGLKNAKTGCIQGKSQISLNNSVQSCGDWHCQGFPGTEKGLRDQYHTVEYDPFIKSQLASHN